jgi:hypothetical protein
MNRFKDMNFSFLIPANQTASVIHSKIALSHVEVGEKEADHCCL